MKQKKVIGIMGGMGPEATRDLFSKIIAATEATKDQDHLEIIIHNYPQVPDRTANILGSGEDPVPAMLKSARCLQRAGADFLIIPCMSAHFFLDRLREGSPLPILSAFDATARAITTQDGVRRVGLLATSGTIEGGRFAQVLEKHDIETMTPDAEHQAMVMEAIYGGIKSDPAGERRDEFKQLLLKAADWLAQRGAEGVIAGCTEIPLVLGQEDLETPFFDTLDILARAAITHACA